MTKIFSPDLKKMLKPTKYSAGVVVDNLEVVGLAPGNSFVFFCLPKSKHT
jgi:hypothetical protein